MGAKPAEIIAYAIGASCRWLFYWLVLDALHEILKRLKRITDALEKDGDNDG